MSYGWSLRGSGLDVANPDLRQSGDAFMDVVFRFATPDMNHWARAEEVASCMPMALVAESRGTYDAASGVVGFAVLVAIWGLAMVGACCVAACLAVNSTGCPCRPRCPCGGRAGVAESPVVVEMPDQPGSPQTAHQLATDKDIPGRSPATTSLDGGGTASRQGSRVVI